MEETLKVSDVCKVLNCSKTTVYRYVQAGKLRPAFKIGRGFRFTPEEIERFQHAALPSRFVGEPGEMVVDGKMFINGEWRDVPDHNRGGV